MAWSPVSKFRRSAHRALGGKNAHIRYFNAVHEKARPQRRMRRLYPTDSIPWSWFSFRFDGLATEPRRDAVMIYNKTTATLRAGPGGNPCRNLRVLRTNGGGLAALLLPSRRPSSKVSPPRHVSPSAHRPCTRLACRASPPASLTLRACLPVRPRLRGQRSRGWQERSRVLSVHFRTGGFPHPPCAPP